MIKGVNVFETFTPTFFVIPLITCYNIYMQKQLLSSTKMGSLELQNRVFMAPMTRSRADNKAHAPFDIHATYYAQRASAGLIITEGTVVSPQGVGYIHVPGIYSEAQVEGWKTVTDAVHAKGGKIFCQIWHVGRVSHPDFHDGKLPVAPSAINPGSKSFTQNGLVPTVTPRELTKAEIAQIVRDFRRAGENAMKAGFDGIEIHSSNGYLFHQFFNNSSNQRTDEYGGSNENKTRFLFEVIDALKEVMPEDRIGLRLNPMMHESHGIIVDHETADTFDYIVERLNGYDLAFLHISKPFGGTITGPDFIEDVIGHYRKIYKGFLVANTNYTLEGGEADIVSGRADAIAYGRPFISNPDLVERFEQGAELAKPDRATFYTPGTKGYTDYPSLN